MPTKPGDPTSMGEKASGRIPPIPRLLVNNIVIMPLVDDEWKPLQDQWVLPGCRVLTTDEVRTLAAAHGWAVDLINPFLPKEKAA